MVEAILLKILLIAKALLGAGKVPLLWATKAPVFLVGVVLVSVVLVTMLLVGLAVTLLLVFGSWAGAPLPRATHPLAAR